MLIGVLLGLLSISLPGCGASRIAPSPARERQRTTERYEFARVLMGTKCRIVVFAPSEPVAADACAAAFERIADLEAVMSDYRPDSEAATVLGLEPRVWHPISPDLAALLARCELVHRASGGAFDPAVGPLTKLWRASRRSGRLPDPSVLAEARERSGMEKLETDAASERIRFARSGMGLDFGGIGKGFAADGAMRVLSECGLRAALIDFGGDVVVGDAPPDQPGGWSLRVRDGLGTPRTLRLSNAAVATSGDLEQSVEIDGKRYSHIIDPRSGLGLTRRTASTVVADSGWKADALASAACVLGPENIELLRRSFPGAVIEVVGGPPDRPVD
tara:strand:- start:65905 stop:66900 length:996 start_codon:yes stop_codon:yes gene_type:complete